MIEVYWLDPYKREINTRVKDVRKVKKNVAISLEENIFYPGGGGQPPDKGYIVLEEGGPIFISKLLKIGSEVFLILPISEEISINTPVYAKIDWNRRYKHMRCHTAAHVVMGAIRRKVKNYNPAGINILDDGESVIVKFRGDWSAYEDEAKQIIKIANDVISRDLKVITEIYGNISKAIEKYEDIYRGPRNLTGEIRIVAIEGWDANPCGGTHVRRLKEIGELRYVRHNEQEITFSIKKVIEDDQFPL